MKNNLTFIKETKGVFWLVELMLQHNTLLKFIFDAWYQTYTKNLHALMPLTDLKEIDVVYKLGLKNGYKNLSGDFVNL